MLSKSLAKIKLAPKYRALFLLTLILAITFLPPKLQHKCQSPFREDSYLTMPNGRQIGVEIAADDSLQQTGLSGRKCLPHNGGMLFSFQQPGYYQFWMKDMYFPLDIVWLDSDHKVVSINQYVLPQTYPKTFTSSSPAQYVIEINQGLVAKLGLTAGQLISF